MKLLVASLVLMFAPVVASAVELPTGHDPNSDILIDYGDLNFVLASSVLDMGPSTHQRAPRVRPDSATRIYGGSRKASRFEGNRVAFHLFEDSHRDVLVAIRDDLLNLPEQVRLESLTRRQQLAYFLNLHNSIVLAKVADEYPVTHLEPWFNRNNSKAFIVAEYFKLGDQHVTLADIQDHVLENWRDPLVIYGFYMGAVGTPNIRQDAFDGERVFEQLRENARNFVNSVRGTQVWHTGELRVASYYERMASVFPDFEDDVLRHVQEYARPAFARRLVGISAVDPRIDDWNIADLYNGHLHQAGRTGPRTIQDGEGTLLGQPGIPLHVVHTLKGRINNFKRFKGTVDIEELEPAKEADGAEETDDKENPDQ